MITRARYLTMSGGYLENSSPFGWELGSVDNNFHEEENNNVSKLKRRGPIDSHFFEVRQNAICVVGLHSEAVRDVKNQIGALLKVPIPLESFHVKSPADIKDGVLLVPKLVLVAAHCPGRKLIDEQGDEGQLDYLYDEASELGCDIMMIYVRLPKSIYPSNKHAIYHPKMEEMVFPTSPLLRHLASENCFFTITETTKLSTMQKNVLAEWITKPVNSEHPVFEAANYLSSVESEYESDFYSSIKKGEAGGATASAVLMFDDENDVDFKPATEEHPLADRKKKKKKKKEKKNLSFRKRKAEHNMAFDEGPDLINLGDQSEDRQNSFELDMYREGGIEIDTTNSSIML